MYKIVLWLLVFFSLIPGVWANKKVANDPTLKPWVQKPLIHSLNDTDVHRLCQYLGCGDLVTNFTSKYNASAVKHNYIPPNHPILDNPYAKWNANNILEDVDFVEKHLLNNESGIYWGEYEEETSTKNYEYDDVNSTTLEEDHPSDVTETNDVTESNDVTETNDMNVKQLMDVEAVYIIIGCATTACVLLLGGILVLLWKCRKMRVANLQIQQDERNQQQLDIELLDFVSINLDE